MPETATTKARMHALELAGLLPAHAQLWIDEQFSILSLITDEGALLEQQLLSPTEMYVILSLVENYPDYCPYEVVLSVMTGKSIDDCRQNVLWGMEEGAIDSIMRPVRNLLGRTRMKLRPFGIDVKSLINMGYMLVPRSQKLRRP